jgi:predicted ATP-binding protein involved in virulence
MRLTEIRVKNLLEQRDFNLEFDQKVTIIPHASERLIRDLSQAICAGLWPLVRSFDLAINRSKDPGFTLLKNRAPHCDTPFSIQLSGSFGEHSDQTWTRSSSLQTKSKLNDSGAVKSLKKWGSNLQQRCRMELVEYEPLPVLQFHSFDSAPSACPQDNTGSTGFYSRTFGYRDCLSSDESTALCIEWFKWFYLCYREHQIHAMEGRPVEAQLKAAETMIGTIQSIIDAFTIPLTGWGEIAYSVSHNRSVLLKHNDHGTQSLGSLDEKIQSLVTLVLGIVHRCIKLNPHMKAEAMILSSGVVVIDASSMPANWHNHVVTTLTDTFPGIQFVILSTKA